MAIDLHYSPEIETIVRYLQRIGVRHKVTSTIRPGAITISGNLSYHARGTAVDVASPQPSLDSDELAAIFKAFLPVERHLAELIYAGPQVTYNIDNGKRVGKYAQSIHHNHVHVAIAKGVSLDNLGSQAKAEHSDETVNEADRSEDMADPIGGVCAPNGGVWVATRDGGLRAYGGAPYYGSVPHLKPENRRVGLPFVDIKRGAPDDPDAEGYTIYGSDGASYHFNQAVLDALNRGEI